MNVPVPAIYLNEDKKGVFSVIDGKQRLLSVQTFFADELVLQGLAEFPELNGARYSTLPPDLRASLSTLSTLRSVVLLERSDPTIKFEVFIRLNRGGVQLNAQEIRNSTWPGPLNDLLLEMSAEPRFRRLLGVRDPDRSAIVREMRDAELILRFFTFAGSWREFRGGMAVAMNEFMVRHQYAKGETLRGFANRFRSTLDGVEVLFGEHAFQRWQPEKGEWRNQLLAALFDAEMLAVDGLDPGRLAPKQDQFLSRFLELFSDPSFREAIDAATNTPVLFERRIARVRDLVEAMLG